MPFKSSSQLRLCYSKKASQKSSWDCDKWLKETKNPECLPHKANMPPLPKGKCRPIRAGEPIVGPVITGPRGGKYFMVAGIKITLPRNYIKKIN